MPFLPDISPELIDFLIEKEKKEQEKQYEMPFLQLPVPEMAKNLPKNDEKSPVNDENGAIILDIQRLKGVSIKLKYAYFIKIGSVIG